MRVRVLALCVFASWVTMRPAAAFVVECSNERGFAPMVGTVLPPHPHVVYFGLVPDTGTWGATIGGHKVKVKATARTGGSDAITELEIESSWLGTLEIRLGKRPMGTYEIKPKSGFPSEAPVVIGRFRRQLDQESIDGNFDGLGIWMPEGIPAVLAHVKLRRDDLGPWFEIDAPVVTSPEQPRPVIRIGMLGCSPNYPITLLAKGVDIEVAVTLVDGSPLRLTNLASHLTLPDPLPSSPRPRRVRR